MRVSTLRCPACQSETAAGQRFCAACGVRLAEACPRCRASLPAGVRFCSQCGIGVADAGGAPADAVEGERRQITVVFCDLVDSTPLARRLDPEDFGEVLAVYQEAVAGVVHGFDGHVAQYLGDGVLVYFGYPRAHEDDALRAVSAAVGIRAAIPAIRERICQRVPAFADQPIQLRFGVHTGPVVVGPVGDASRGEPLALGDTVNLAARLQTRAEPDQILISQPTRQLLKDAFVTEDVGLQSLKGVAEPVWVWRVLEATGSGSRLATCAPSDLTPLVGRASEIAELLAGWERVKQGVGQALLLLGEAGVGKSRLVHALHQSLEREELRWIECCGSALHQNSAFHPVVAFLAQRMELRRDQPTDEQIARLERAVTDSGLPLRETMPLFASLLSVSLPPDYPVMPVGSEELRARTLDWLARWLIGVGGRQPVVLVVEDLHWVDASTLELLGVLLERARAAPVLFVMTSRPDFTPPWPDLERIVLQPLGRSQTEAMVQLLASGRELPANLVAEIAARTDGVPLFVEELTRTVLEEKSDAAKASTAVAIPFTIQDSLMARIDRLGPAKQVAQIASVLGREFPHELLAAVSSLEAPVLERALAQLAAAGLVQRRGRPSHATWIFKHALVRDVAYHSLLRSSRRQQHARTAEILEKHFPELVESEPEVVALHFEEGGLTQRAVDHYARAAEVAARRSAHAEAIRQLRRGLELLDRLPGGPGRDRREFELQAALGAPLIALHGYGEPEAARAFERARALCDEVDEGPRLLRAVYGLSTYYQARADLPTSIELGEQCLTLAEKIGDASFRMLGHLRLGLSLFYGGESARALVHHEKAAALYDPAQHRRLAFVYGQDLGALAALYSALALWTLGHPRRARERCEQALRFAHESDHPHTRAFIAGFAAVVHQMLREPDRAEAFAAESIALGQERGFALWVGFGGVLRGWARAVLGKDAGAAVEEIRRSLGQLSKLGTIVGGPYFLGLLAEAQGVVGDEEQALASLDAALAFAQARGITYWQPELLRLRAERLQDRDPAAARLGFERALDVARQQGARSHELRIATSASRLLSRLGRKDEAVVLLRAALEPLAAEGETLDLQEARALLASLA